MEGIEDNIELQMKSNEIANIGDRAVREVQENNRKEGVPNVFSVDGKVFYEVNGVVTTTNPFEHLKVTPSDKVIVDNERFGVLYDDKDITDAISRDALDVVSKIQKLDINKVTFVVMMNGGAWFASRLFNRLQANVYPIVYATTSCKNDKIKVSTKAKRKDFKDRQIIIIEGFSNSGRSISKLTSWLEGMGAESVDTCLMFKREGVETKTINTPIIINENECIMGCGLGYKERGRNFNILYKKL